VSGSAPRRLTADALARLPDDGWRYELRRGVLLREPPAGGEHGWLGVGVAARLRAFVAARRLGYVFGADTGFLIACAPDTVRAPDVSFVAAQRLPAGPPAGYVPLAPDLAVELVSPSDRRPAVRRKVDDWLAAGTPLVWVIDPRARQAVVHTVAGAATLGEADVLDGAPVLADFRVRVGELLAG
jgi:Uma2 family endonuclease